MVQIMGVDFSGAEKTNATWVCEGSLNKGKGVLTIRKLRSLSKRREEAHNELKSLLQKLPINSVVGMDFPFSVPEPFARFWRPDSNTMPELWNEASRTNYDRFKKVRDEFVLKNGEMLRHGDTYFGGPLSPLKTGGPNMLPMTFYGMKMLQELWQSEERRFIVPPLPEEDRTGPVLLETMPGVILRRLNLPAENYKNKNKTNKKKPETFRQTILGGLQSLSTPIVSISEDLCNKCIENHDCLDSLVAAVGGAKWAINQSNFLHPRQDDEPSKELYFARLEGWLYAPNPINH